MTEYQRIKPKDLLKTTPLQNEFIDKVRAIIFKRLKGNTYYEDQVIRSMSRDSSGRPVFEKTKKINPYVEDILNTTLEKLINAGVEKGTPFMERDFLTDNESTAIQKIMSYVKLTVASAHSQVDLELGIREKRSKEDVESEIKQRIADGEDSKQIKFSKTKPRIQICIDNDYIEGSDDMTEEISVYQTVQRDHESTLMTRESLIEVYEQVKECFEAVYNKLKTKEDQCFFYTTFWGGLSLSMMDIAKSCGKLFNSTAAISSFFVPKVHKITTCLESKHQKTGKPLITLTAGKWTEEKSQNLFELKSVADTGMDI